MKAVCHDQFAGLYDESLFPEQGWGEMKNLECRNGRKTPRFNKMIDTGITMVIL